jgi:hypothetical protein
MPPKKSTLTPEEKEAVRQTSASAFYYVDGFATAMRLFMLERTKWLTGTKAGPPRRAELRRYLSEEDITHVELLTDSIITQWDQRGRNPDAPLTVYEEAQRRSD